MKRLLRHAALALSLATAGLFSGCAANEEFQGIQSAKIAMRKAITEEQPGDYYVGRRFYKQDYKFWGYVRRPGAPWSTAQLVMLNEQQKLAPDRTSAKLGSDNGYEYTLKGEFSGQTVYEPASNGKYPEFVLRDAEVRSMAPAPIFGDKSALDPAVRIIAKPN